MLWRTTQATDRRLTEQGMIDQQTGYSEKTARTTGNEAGSRAPLCSHLDLFSGIGGFALAAKRHGMKTVAFCEIDPWARRVLNKNFPSVPIHEDVRQLSGKQYEGITLLTAGYPCQPFSRAGKQRGTEDDRHLWPEVLRITKQARPSWCLFENVTDHEYMGLDEVLADLERSGYQGRPLIIPAAAVQSNHARERLWIIAYDERTRAELEEHHGSGQGREPAPIPQRKMVSGGNGEAGAERAESGCVLLNGETFSVDGQSEPLFLGSAHGIPNRLDRRRGLGNAIHPRIAYELIGAIISCENANCDGTP